MTDEKKQQADKATKDHFALVLGGVLAFSIAIAAFVAYKYHLHFPGPPTTDHTAWGTLGDYVGGVLNPVFSFFSLLALLYALYLQRKDLNLTRIELERSTAALVEQGKIADRQLNSIKREEKKEDIFRMITAVFKDIEIAYKSLENKVFVRHSQCQSTLEECHDRQATLTPISYVIGNTKEFTRFENFVPANNSIIGPINQRHLEPFTSLIKELYEYLYEFQKLAGDSTLTSYYKKRSLHFIIDLVGKGYLTDEVMVDFFIDD